METLTERLHSARQIVMKVGSAQVIDANGAPNLENMAGLAADIYTLKAQGKQIALVSSGAGALGRAVLGLEASGLKLAEKQAAAAAGQIKLMRAWEDVLATQDIQVAQALLTIGDTETRRRWLNARSTLSTLMDAGIVPVINENDTVATEEIRYGDNDRLAARSAQMIGADIMFLLSDIDGLYTEDPRKSDKAEHIPLVDTLTPEIMAMGGDANAGAGVGSGGMATKLEAARIAWTAGCATVIGLGQRPAGKTYGPVEAISQGARATLFLPELTPETARRQWLAGSLTPAGSYIVDDGAIAALRNGKSLLPAGATTLTGQFQRGDAVAVEDGEGTVWARGISAYSSDDALRILGHNSDEIEEILGYRGRPALIHRDDLVLDDTTT